MTRKKSNKPKPVPLRQQILEFFERNPDEELRRSDAAEKFNRNIKTIDSVLSDLRRKGVMEVAHVWRRKQGPSQ